MEFMGRHAFQILVRSLTTPMIVNVQFTTIYSTIISYYVLQNGVGLVASCQKLKSKISSKDSKFQTE